jgi:hypothetical protein
VFGESGVEMKKAFFNLLLITALIIGFYTCFMPCNCEKGVVERITIEQFQLNLIESGHPLPIYGADGRLGDETEAAWNDWSAE